MRTTASSKTEEQLATAAAAAAAAADDDDDDDDDTAAEADDLIPGLPDDIAKHCLIHLPFPYHFLARSVSSSWNRTLTSAAFLRFKAAAQPLHPTLFVFAYHRLSLRLHCQALDPLSGRWFLLPPMPLSSASPHCLQSFAATALPSRGELYVLGGMDTDTETPLASVYSYRAATNAWSPAASMPAPRSSFTAGAIGGRILAAATGGADVYDPAADRWAPAAEMPCGMARYDAAVTGSRMFVTEGWTWPFAFSPRGWVYDGESGTWGEMRQGMKEGWTGLSAVVGGWLFVVLEYGDRRVKVYEEGEDTWRAVGGSGVPTVIERPYVVAGADDGRIYVVGKGFDVAVGRVVGGRGKEWWVEWEVVRGPRSTAELAPCSAHVLYV